MYKKDLDSLLNRPNPPRAYLLYGASEFLISHYGSKIATLLSSGQEVQRFFYDECDVEHIHSLLSQNSLFGGDTFILLKLDKKLDKKSCESLLKAIESNPNNALVIEFHISSAKSEAEYMQDARTFASAFKSSLAVEVRFFEPSVQESMEFLGAYAKRLGLEIHTQDLRYILELQNGDLSIAHKEIEKFCIGLDSQSGVRRVSSEEVRFLCEGIASFSVEELFCAVMDKKPFMKILQNIYEEGTNEVMLVRELQRFFYQLFLFFSYIKTHGNLNASEILGFNPPKHILERQRKYCLYFKEADYIEIFDLLNRWDRDAKSGKSKNSLTTLIKIQAMLR
ncbi:DNA polymerase III subunit delta [uncultured Helicobacter sp.]|uniref:DNA polymerase III subunit delta n=1 Tax=uncultured Helicobacter sp. TaxID=175537 RepID=UPI00374EC897